MLGTPEAQSTQDTQTQYKQVVNGSVHTASQDLRASLRARVQCGFGLKHNNRIQENTSGPMKPDPNREITAAVWIPTKTATIWTPETWGPSGRRYRGHRTGHQHIYPLLLPNPKSCDFWFSNLVTPCPCQPER